MVIIVMGVSGSGKTAVGKMLASRLGWEFEDADKWHPAGNVEKMHRGVALTDEDRRPWLLALNEAIRKWIAEKCDVVLACSALRVWYRDMLRDGVTDSAALRFVYLKGSYEEIDRRLKARVGHFFPESLLETQFATLEEPDSSEALIVEINPPVTEIVETIVKRLQFQ